MGRTILSATQTWVEEEKALRRFVRALRKSDQSLMQELLALSRQHIAEASYASNLYPMDIYLVSMLLETYRKVKRLELRLEQMGVKVDEVPIAPDDIPELPSLIDLTSPVMEKQGTNEEHKGKPSGCEYVKLQDGA